MKWGWIRSHKLAAWWPNVVTLWTYLIWSTQLSIRFEFKYLWCTCVPSLVYHRPYHSLLSHTILIRTFMLPTSPLWLSKLLIPWLVSKMSFLFWHTVVQPGFGKRVLNIPAQSVDLQTRPAVPSMGVGIPIVVNHQLWFWEVIAILPSFNAILKWTDEPRVRNCLEEAKLHTLYETWIPSKHCLTL